MSKTTVSTTEPAVAAAPPAAAQSADAPSTADSSAIASAKFAARLALLSEKQRGVYDAALKGGMPCYDALAKAKLS